MHNIKIMYFLCQRKNEPPRKKGEYNYVYGGSHYLVKSN
jgi:hypothetical protein